MSFQSMKQQSKRALTQLNISLAGNYAEEMMNGVYNAVTHARASFKPNLNEKSEEDNAPFLEEISDEDFLSKRTTELACEMRLVAFHKTIEMAIKDMLGFCGLFSKEELKLIYKHKELKKLFKKTLCDLEDLIGYSAYDELRCINNCIKNAGRVDKELAQFSGWKENKKLKPEKLDDAYWRLKPDVDIFLCEIKSKLIKKIR